MRKNGEALDLSTSRTPALNAAGVTRGLAQSRTSLIAKLAAAWSLLYAAAAMFWALGGSGFPFGQGDPEAADMGSLFVGMTADVLAPLIAAWCTTAAMVGFAMATPRNGFMPRRVILAAGWSMTALLVLAIPDVRLLRDFA